jgi:GNAT superfamily N-acetyltransferase
VARPAHAEDFDAWDQLFAAYCDFYARPSTPEHRRQVWSWIEAGTIHCLVAVPPEGAAAPAAPAAGPESTTAGRPVGLAHVRPVLSPLRGAAVGFLDDLFIAPAARGSGAFECLIAAIGGLAAAEGWSQVRWITAADNTRARAAYDRVATKTDWVTYQLDV